MNVFASLSLGSAIAIFTLGVIIITKNPRESLNRLFFLCCLSCALLSFSEFRMRISESFLEAYIWFTISNSFPIISIFLFHFCLVFSEKFNKQKIKKFAPLLYIFGIFITSLAFVLVLFGRVPIKKYWGWTYTFPSEPLLFNLILMIVIMQTILLILSLLLILRVYFNSNSGNIKKTQAKYISIGLFIPISIYIWIDFVINLIFSVDIPELVSIGFLFLCGLFFYAMGKYELFSLDLMTASEKIFSTMSDYLILTNPEGKILSFSQNLIDILEYQEKELVEKPFDFLLVSKQDLKLYHYQLQLLSSEENGEFLKDIEVDFETKSNNKIKISLTASKINDKNGKLQGIIYIGRDITKERKIEQQLDEVIQKSQFKSKFMSTMSHELRTPLNIIIGFTELLSQKDYGYLNQDQISFVEDIMGSAEHLLDLINKIIDISKIESGKLKLELKKFHLFPIIIQTVSSFKPLIQEKGLNFYLVGIDKKMEIIADPIRFKQIINNLMSNALKYTKKGSITLEIIENNNDWMINVIDTGIGIEKNNYDLVFQEFERINLEYIRGIEGSGLGLPIAKRLINLHGGQIYFKSEFQKGTTFTFTIPKIFKKNNDMLLI